MYVNLLLSDWLLSLDLTHSVALVMFIFVVVVVYFQGFMSFSFPCKHADLFSVSHPTAEQVGVFTGETKAHN